MLGREGDGEALVAWLSIRCPILFAGVRRRFNLSCRQTAIAQDQCPLRGCSYLHTKAKERGTIKQMLNHESSHASLLKSKGALSRPLSRPTAALSTSFHNSGDVHHSAAPPDSSCISNAQSQGLLAIST